MTAEKKLTVKANKISCDLDLINQWSLDIDQIKFIGEYTTSAGPFVDDYFFVFADTVDQWWQASTLAVDPETFWKELGEKLNCKLIPGLFASTSWATRVMYPLSLEGQELFKLVKEESKPKTFWQKLFGSSDENERIELTEPVKSLFKKD